MSDPATICEERGHVLRASDVNIAPRQTAACVYCGERLRWVSPTQGHWRTSDDRYAHVVPGKGIDHA